MDWKAQLAMQAINYLAPVVLALAGTLITMAINWVRVRTNNDQAAAALERLSHTTATVVAELQQTVVPKLRAASIDGKLSPEDQRELRHMVLARVKDTVSPEVLRLARRALADTDRWLLRKAEQSVLRLKRREPRLLEARLSQAITGDGR